MKILYSSLFLTTIFFSFDSVSGREYRALSLERWNFNSYLVEYHDDWTAKLIQSDPAIAEAHYSPESGHYQIEGHRAEGRGEISTDGLQLDPFTWYEVEIEYRTSGSPDSMMILTGLYPEGSRLLMDQVHLPSTGGSVASRRILLHTGSHSGLYHFFAGQVGPGQSAFFSFRFREFSPYETPGTAALVVDLLKPGPDPDNLNLWSSARKFKELYGFSELGYMHPLKISRSGITKMDPGLIVFSPTATDTDDLKLGFLKKKRHARGISRIIRYAEENGIPVLGICAGHQSIALHYGAFLARLKDDESGMYLKELGPTTIKTLMEDPLFADLPDSGSFRIMEAHQIVVGYNFRIPLNLAESKDFGNQIFRYNHAAAQPWYTFQGHIEKDWEYACPEGSLVFENMLAGWGLVQKRSFDSVKIR